MNGRKKYYERNEPVQQKHLDEIANFDTSRGTKSCKTTAIVNSYLADGKTFMSEEQLGAIVKTDSGEINSNLHKEGWPERRNAFSRDVARVLGLKMYNHFDSNVSRNYFDESTYTYFERTEASIIFMKKPGHSHYIYRDAKGIIDSLPAKRKSASGYKIINQQMLEKRFLPEVWKLIWNGESLNEN